MKTLLRNIILLLPKYHVAFAAEVSGIIAIDHSDDDDDDDDDAHYGCNDRSNVC